MESDAISRWKREGNFTAVIGALERPASGTRTFEDVLNIAEAYIRLGEADRSRQMYCRAMDMLETMQAEGAEDSRWLFYMGWATKRLGGGNHAELLTRAVDRDGSLEQALNLLLEERKAGWTPYRGRGEMQIRQHLSRVLSAKYRIEERRFRDGLVFCCGHSWPTQHLPWQSVVTLGLGVNGLSRDSRVCGDAPDRVELFMRFPGNMDLSGMELPVAVYRAAQKWKDTGGWFAPGMILPLQKARIPFSAVLLEEIDCLPDGDCVMAPSRDGRIILYEALFLTAREARYCATDARVQEVYQKRKDSDLSSAPGRADVCGEVLPEDAEEKVLAELEKRQEAPASQDAQTLRVLLKQAECLLRSPEDQEGVAQTMELLEQARKRAAADPMWLRLRGQALLWQGELGKGSAVLNQARLRGAITVREQERIVKEAREGGSRYTMAEQRELLDCVRSCLPLQQTCWMRVKEDDDLEASCYVRPASDGHAWTGLVTVGVGTKLFPAGEGTARERVELVLGLPDIWDTGSVWHGTDLGRLAAEFLSHVIWAGWRGSSLHPGTVFDRPDDVVEYPGGNAYSGSIITHLPEELSGLRRIRLSSGRVICFYRLMFLFPEETDLVQAGRAEELAKRLEQVPLGLEAVRPAVTEAMLPSGT